MSCSLSYFDILTRHVLCVFVIKPFPILSWGVPLKRLLITSKKFDESSSQRSLWGWTCSHAQCSLERWVWDENKRKAGIPAKRSGPFTGQWHHQPYADDTVFFREHLLPPNLYCIFLQSEPIVNFYYTSRMKDELLKKEMGEELKLNFKSIVFFIRCLLNLLTHT